jgi:hypothetical protein
LAKRAKAPLLGAAAAGLTAPDGGETGVAGAATTETAAGEAGVVGVATAAVREGERAGKGAAAPSGSGFGGRAAAAMAMEGSGVKGGSAPKGSVGRRKGVAPTGVGSGASEGECAGLPCSDGSRNANAGAAVGEATAPREGLRIVILLVLGARSRTGGDSCDGIIAESCEDESVTAAMATAAAAASASVA